MPRSKWKVPYTQPDLLNRLDSLYIDSEVIYEKDPHAIKPRRHQVTSKFSVHTSSRSTTILSSMIGLMFYIHNGKKFVPVRIKSFMVGKKLGEFVPTRKILSHKKLKKK
jgi:ribosomal protein S19